MNTSILNVLRDTIFYNLTVLCNGIKLDLVCLCHELRDNDWVLLADLRSHLKEAHKFLVVVAYVHGCAREYVRWANKHRETNALNECIHVFHACEGAPLWLVDAELVEHGRELTTVLGTVD